MKLSVVPSSVSEEAYDLRRAWGEMAPANMPADVEQADDDLVGVDEVAAQFGMSLRWVYDTFSVAVPPMKFGNRSRWYRWQLKAYAAEKYRAAAR